MYNLHMYIYYQNGDSLLQIAVRYNYGRVTRVLLEHGASVDVVDKVTLMIDNTCMYNLHMYIYYQNGDSLLQIAVRYGYEGITRALLEHGASADVVDKVTLMIDNMYV